MEWRIILPVVCVLGILLVPGSTALNGTVTNATSTNATSTNGTGTNTTGTNTTATNVTTANATATNATATNAAATNATATNVTTANATATNVTTANATATNVTTANATVTNATATNATATNATATNATAANATAANATDTNATAANVTTANATVTNATATTATATNATVTNATATNATATIVTATNATITNATVTNATFTNATATNATLTNATATNATATNATLTNATATNVTATNATATIATVTNATATNATSANLTGTNVTTTNATATNATSANSTGINVTTTNATATNSTGTNVMTTNATATNSTGTNVMTTNATATNSTGTNVMTTNATATTPTSANATASNGTTTNPTAPAVTEFNITYSINKPFLDIYTNLNHPETITLKDNITSQIESVYKKQYPKFRRYIIRKFRNGSIVTEGALEFNANNSNPNVSELAKVLVDAVTSGNLSIDIKNDSITVTTATPPTPIITSQINVSFSINNTFNETLSNISSPDAIELAKNITTQFVTVFKRRYANLLRMFIRKFSKGSIVTDSALEFSDNGTVPKVQEVVDFIVAEAKGGNFSLPIDVKSITATDSAGNTATSTPPTPINSSQINVTFSINDNFNETLSNISSPEAIKLANNITTQFVTVFKRRYANLLRMFIRKFSKGSIETHGALEFNNNGTVPNAKEVVDVIIDAVKAGNFSFEIDPKSIKVTDSSGNTASKGSSPVISSMFTVMLMALASLLLSGVMHQ